MRLKTHGRSMTSSRKWLKCALGWNRNAGSGVVVADAKKGVWHSSISSFTELCQQRDHDH